MKHVDATTRARRASWAYRGAHRPHFAAPTGPGQESVWDYPRPPVAVADSRRVTVRFDRRLLAESDAALRVLETASPPTLYVPPGDVRWPLLELAIGSSHCEWKGAATYWDVVVGGGRVLAAGWSYADPYPEFESIRDYVAFYPARVACRLGDVAVSAQPGSVYGGWVTPELVGPFKGEPGTEDW